MNHSFNVKLAEKYSLEEAIMIEAIYTWVHINECNDEMFKEGRTWCYSTAKGFNKYIPYMSAQKIRRILLKLEDRGFIKIGNFNNKSLNQTLWYAFSDMAIKELIDLDYDFSKLKNGFFKNEKCECNIKECNNKNNIKESTNVDEKTEESKRSGAYVDENGETSFLEPIKDNRDELYMIWANKEFPRMMKMQVPLSYQNFVKLRDKYGQELVVDKMANLDNDKKTLKNKVDAYRTLENWCKRDSKGEAA